MKFYAFNIDQKSMRNVLDAVGTRIRENEEIVFIPDLQ